MVLDIYRVFQLQLTQAILNNLNFYNNNFLIDILCVIEELEHLHKPLMLQANEAFTQVIRIVKELPFMP